MPLIEDDGVILPIMPTGSVPPNPMRTFVDDLPMVATFFAALAAAIIVILVLAVYGPKLRDGFVKIINHLRTPVG